MLPKTPQPLEAAIDDIWAIARGFGLDPFPVHFEVVPATIMYEFGAYGLPGRFSHWTHGRAYHQMKTMYDYGLSKIYELVINTDPSLAFLLDTNTPLQNKLVVAHVLGHADFFKHNAFFRDTDRRMVESAAAHAEALRRYEFAHGPLAVEQYLDAALAIDVHVEPTRPARPTPATPTPARTTPYDDLFGIGQPAPTPAAPPARRIPPEPTADFLRFLMEYAPDLEDWQRDILAIIRTEMLYFFPQMRTKIANEGWAALWHARILRELPLTDGEVVEFAELNASVTAPTGRRLNPYRVGLAILNDIKRRWDEPTDEERRIFGRTGGQGDAQLFDVRSVESDASLVRNYLTADLIKDLDLFLYRKEGDRWVVAEADAETVRNTLANELAGFGRPRIRIVDGDYHRRRDLYLQHAEDDGPLDLVYAKGTLEQLFVLWRRPVHLETTQEKQRVVLTYDGNAHATRAAGDAPA